MNMDFHYYATYLAARVAGYEKEEAKTIACAAQYVDESDAGMIDKKLLPGMAETTPTIESMGTLLGRNVDASGGAFTSFRETFMKRMTGRYIWENGNTLKRF